MSDQGSERESEQERVPGQARVPEPVRASALARVPGQEWEPELEPELASALEQALELGQEPVRVSALAAAGHQGELILEPEPVPEPVRALEPVRASALARVPGQELEPELASDRCRRPASLPTRPSRCRRLRSER